jgi:hypothetical protein
MCGAPVVLSMLIHAPEDTNRAFPQTVQIATGGAAQTTPVNGRIPVDDRPDLVHSDHNGLFASGTLGRYSKVLSSVVESRLRH